MAKTRDLAITRLGFRQSFAGVVAKRKIKPSVSTRGSCGKNPGSCGRKRRIVVEVSLAPSSFIDQWKVSMPHSRLCSCQLTHAGEEKADDAVICDATVTTVVITSNSAPTAFVMSARLLARARAHTHTHGERRQPTSPLLVG